MKIGWIGCGDMGSRMAKRLIDAGHEVYLYNRTRSKAEAIAGAAGIVDAPCELADTEIVFSSVTNGNALRAVVFGDKGWVKTAKPGSILVEMSTISPDDAEEVRTKLEAAGLRYLNVPVVGSMFMVEKGILGSLVSGQKEACDTVAPLLMQIGNRYRYMGDGVKARIAKLASNMLICGYFELLGETLACGEALGCAWMPMIDAIAASPAGCRLIGNKGNTLAERQWSSGVALTHTALKDLSLALGCAYEKGIAMPVCAQARQWTQFMNKSDRFGTYSTFGTVGTIEELAGLSFNEAGNLDEAGQAEAQNVLITVLCGLNAQLTSEAVALCEAYGIEKSLAMQCLAEAFGCSTAVREQADRIAAGTAESPCCISSCGEAIQKCLEVSKEKGLMTPTIGALAQILAIKEDVGILELI